MDVVGYGAVEFCKCFWGFLAKPISYISNPTKKLRLLGRELSRLLNKSADIEERVVNEEVELHGRRTNQVAGWLKEVEHLKAECGRVLEEGNFHQQSNCLLWCYSCKCWSNYKLGKKIRQLYNDVRECQAAGEFPYLVTLLPPPRVREMPMEKTVGLDSMLSQVWEYLQEKHVGIIGLYGMGGVGKTTLLKRINREFRCMSHEFHVVLWIVVSKQVNLDKIRECMRKDLGIGERVWRDRSEEEARATELCRVLNNKKFVLLIDDIWERLDFERIGIPIPSPENGSKIVFTTRSERVCGQMKANKKVKVQCLSPQEALQLFKDNVGEDTLNSHPDIPTYATNIAVQCKGLPLALVAIGRAMSSMNTCNEWSTALRVLTNYPPEFTEMVDVYKLLCFSYDRLDLIQQQCFLYCALYPEDHEIREDHLIDLWIGEGFLGETNSIHRTRDRGELILESLKSACLLESGQREIWKVKMHDVIRDMALWLLREQGKRNNKIIVEEDDKQIATNIFRWRDSERISLQSLQAPGPMNNLTELPVCSSLLTLLINDTDLETLPEWFFMSLQALRVLEIHSKLKKDNPGNLLPRGIGTLVNLRYLNLSNTNIEVLPDEIAKLTYLLYLLLDKTNKLKNIQKEVIASLRSLKVFRKTHMTDCTYKDEGGFIEGVECLKQLDELSLTIHKAFSVQKLFESPNLQGSIRNLEIESCFDLSKISDNLLRRSELKNLHRVHIQGCDATSLSWLIYAPNLRKLEVSHCSSLEKIIDEDILQHVDENASATRLFSSLILLNLVNLPKLRSIHVQTLSSPSLAWIQILRCHTLKKLPFDSKSGKNSLILVEADLGWWSELEWDDKDVEAFFTSKLKSI